MKAPRRQEDPLPERESTRRPRDGSGPGLQGARRQWWQMPRRHL